MNNQLTYVEIGFILGRIARLPKMTQYWKSKFKKGYKILKNSPRGYVPGSIKVARAKLATTNIVIIAS